MKSITYTTISVLILALAAAIGPAHADGPPAFIGKTFPAQGVDSAWETYQSVFLDEEGALDTRTKELIALAISAQVPCDYCVYYHTRASKALGATDAQIKEALAAGALVRKWSTILNGSQYDQTQWRREVDAMFSD